MDIAAQAAHGYRAVRLHTESPRNIEAQLFAEITAGLVRAQRSGKPGFQDLVAVLHRNRALWEALLADLALESNALPTPLKAQLIGLGHFVRQFTARVLRGEDDVQALIDVNNAILEGLRGTRPGEGSGHERP
jgi:flagellar biosynthesis activator protein FlaF